MCASARMYRCDSGVVADIGWPFVMQPASVPGSSLTVDDLGHALRAS